ncbi:MAG: Ig-like domain-containing protein [Patescibacteria group bacterium]
MHFLLQKSWHPHALLISVLTVMAAGFFAASLIPSKAAGNSFYVAPSGSNSNNGSINAPFKTFEPALRAATPGDIIYARGGTYNYDNSMSAGQGVQNFISIQNVTGEYTDIDNGTVGNPIVIRNYPGETPILNMNDSRFNLTTMNHPAVIFREKSFWTLDGFEIINGNVSLNAYSDGNASPNGSLTHDITIQNSNIHHLTLESSENHGLILINRGDNGGAYNISILNNELHDFYEASHPGQWENTGLGGIHLGALTTLSCQSYVGFDCGHTGSITFSGNTVYHVPQAFFFKNPTEGPVMISDNIIHDTESLGTMITSNVTMNHNLVYNVDQGWNFVGRDGLTAQLYTISGQNAVVTNNTFVGLDQLFNIVNGTNHNVQRNVFFGLPDRVPGAGYDTMAYITKSGTYPDPANVNQSILQDITSNNNCFITPFADFQMVQRHVSGTQEHYTHQDATTTFGYDANSTFITQSSATAIFTNPGANDYSLLSAIASQCPANAGYYAAGGGDVTPPTVSVTAPANAATVSGSSVTVSATAADNTGVAGVQFKLDGTNIGSEDTNAPYSITWDSTAATNAAHTLTAVARDAAGNSTISAGISITVNNGAGDTTDPTVNLTAPANGATVSGTVSVTANASDTIGVIGVQFRLDGADLGAEDTTSAYSTSWNTTSASNGSHTLTAIARDAAGNTATASSITVTVSNTGQFSINDRVQVTALLNTRDAPEGNVIGNHQPGALATVTGGPVIQGGYTWWQLDYDIAPDGWSADIYLAAYQPASDTTPPVISSITTSAITLTSGSILWNTDEVADTLVQYGTTLSYGSQSTLNATLTTTHLQTLTGLLPGTTYHYRVISKDASNNSTTSGDNTFTTLADTTPPGQVTDLTAP